jgi:hypothetical protein
MSFARLDVLGCAPHVRIMFRLAALHCGHRFYCFGAPGSVPRSGASVHDQ